MITYGELKAQLRSVLWPSPTEARNLREAHDIFFKEAMVELSKWIPCLRNNNVSLFDACSSFVQCAKSIVESPNGKVKRVYTIANEDWCDPVFYRPRTFPELEAFARQASVWWTQPDNLGMASLPTGIRFHEASVDSPCGRGRIGVYAIHNKRLYLAPWVQSNETIVIEWDGWKRDWNDKDQLDENEWDEQARAAIRAYVKWKHEVFYGCDQARRQGFQAEYENMRAEVRYWCDQKSKPDEEEVLPDDRSPTSTEIKDDVAPDADSDTIFFANIGDYGSTADLPGALNVANLVKSKGPQFIISNGDNDYDGDYDQSVGQYYAQYLSPYSGAFGSGASEQQLFAVPGHMDWNYDGTLEAYKAFFTQNSYYEIVKGPAHFFLLDSDMREPGGTDATSVQAKWLQAKLALSPARWKIVVIHDPPFSSSATDTPGVPRSQWPFKAWGADLVLSGNGDNYERLLVGSTPYIVNGAGGHSLMAFGTVAGGSLIRYNEDWGAGFCTIDCTSLKYEFYNTSGVLIDTLELTK